MKTVSAAEANRQFSKLLRDVQAGEEVVVTSRGRAVARIVPAERKSEAELAAARKALFDRLRSQSALNLPKITRDELYDD
ncbi:type II toxin-antitoxin system Phd/YefM family antitoxin [Labrys wisconsinensis]|uniref:Antitoxin n=1 Tax=Labrys wisconsinensis TaxID=425677 RepID=A0ABU0J690_9HYPH|nr:type II toxin-antitoxin system prevent-host-death family antitoxin [Labrys wisconsinensis]MDQ0469780.1 prevent-host-death family protein [Labrys wisconsinensis]